MWPYTNRAMVWGGNALVNVHDTSKFSYFFLRFGPV